MPLFSVREVSILVLSFELVWRLQQTTALLQNVHKDQLLR